MTYCFHICVGLCVVVFQTTIVPFLPLPGRFYDLLALLVVYLGLFRSAREGIPVILLFGLIMDAFSGVPFGLYTTAYVWLYISARWIIKYLHAGNIFLLPIVVVFGVLMENTIFLVTITLADPGSQLSPIAFRSISWQVLWAFFTGPPLLVFLKDGHIKWDQWVKEQSAERNGWV
jgi:rod shape-determining protein MreD